MKYKLILFDLDGTLLNTIPDLSNSLNYALKNNGQKEKTQEEVKSLIGNGIRNLCESATSDDSKKEKVFSDFKKYYETHLCDESRVYPNVFRLLQELKKEYMLGILSNKKNSYVNVIADYYFKDIFDITLGELGNLKRKPDKEMLEYILDKYNLKREDILYVGDSDIDILFSLNSNIDYVIVNYGYRSEEDLKKLNPKIMISDPLLILNILENM